MPRRGFRAPPTPSLWTAGTGTRTFAAPCRDAALLLRAAWRGPPPRPACRRDREGPHPPGDRGRTVAGARPRRRRPPLRRTHPSREIPDGARLGRGGRAAVAHQRAAPGGRRRPRTPGAPQGRRRQRPVRDAARAGLVQVSVPHGRHLESTGFVVVHQTRRPLGDLVVSGLPTTSAARAAVDLSVRATRRQDVDHLVADVLQRGLADLEQLAAEARFLGPRARPGCAMPSSTPPAGCGRSERPTSDVSSSWRDCPSRCGTRRSAPPRAGTSSTPTGRTGSSAPRPTVRPST